MVIRFEQDAVDPRIIRMIVTISDTQEIVYKLDIAQARRMKRDLEALIPG